MKFAMNEDFYSQDKLKPRETEREGGRGIWRFQKIENKVVE